MFLKLKKCGCLFESYCKFQLTCLKKKKSSLLFGTKWTHYNFAINMNFSMAKPKKLATFVTGLIVISSPTRPALISTNQMEYFIHQCLRIKHPFLLIFFYPFCYDKSKLFFMSLKECNEKDNHNIPPMTNNTNPQIILK